MQVFARFSGHGNPIYNMIPLLKKENVHGYCWINEENCNKIFQALYNVEQLFYQLFLVCFLVSGVPTLGGANGAEDILKFC